MVQSVAGPLRRQASQSRVLLGLLTVLASELELASRLDLEKLPAEHPLQVLVLADQLHLFLPAS